jgi:ubiquinone/menaquinone biosynthesis C-methylase UbiE
MKSKKKPRIIKRPAYISNALPKEHQYSNYLYNSESSLIRLYAYLPLIFTIRNLNSLKNDCVLDLGCADGPFLPTLNYNVKTTIALDINNDYLKESKNLIDNRLSNFKKISLICSDGQNLPFKDSLFDKIFALEVLEHLMTPKKAVEEIHRVLKKDGIFICSLPIEVGFPLLFRNLIGKIFKYERPRYSLKQLLRNIFLKNPQERPEYKGYREYMGEKGHKNFNWRKIQYEIKKSFTSVKIKYFPISFLKGVNPFILIKANK